MGDTAMRPFDFMVPFWGERYRKYFIDLCLPSLLAPNNFPLLQAQDGHRLLIATTPQDWQAIERLPILERVRRHATPVWIEVDGPNREARHGGPARYVATIHYMHYCLKKLFEAAYARRSYGSLLLPDVLFSDHTIASLINRAREGYQLVLSPSMREIEEDVIDDLRRQSYLPVGTRLSLTAGALAISQRTMADLVISHLHPETLPYDQERPVPPFPVPFRYWRVRGGRGLIMHTFVMMLALIDFAAVPPDHADCLDQGDIEKDYIRRNFSDWSRIYVVQDSDEFTTASLAPSAVNWAPPAPERAPRLRSLSELRRLCNIRQSMRVYAAANQDVIRRNLFRLPVRWHRDALDEVWAEEERRIGRMINRAVGDYYKAANRAEENEFPSRRTLLDYVGTADAYFLRLVSTGKGLQRHLLELRRRLWLALRGDPAAKRWVIWRMHVLWRQLQGYTTHPPRPDVP